MNSRKFVRYKSCLPVFLLLCLALAGCGARGHQQIADPLRQTRDGEVDMAALRQMTDDSGLALTDAELRILATPTCALDRNLSPSEMSDVAAQYKYFLRKFRPSMEKFVQRSEEHLAYSKKVFRERGMPEELAYLAIVESGYNPQATSPSGAAGSWQFMPFTGSKYGLEQNWWIDERRDPRKSAVSAADYLKKLYGDFKDWHLAIAAYNAGEGKIGRALEGTGTKNFSDLKLKNHTLDEKARIRDETKQYVPRFIAVCKIMRNLDQLGFKPIRPESAPEKAGIKIPAGTDLLALSQNINSNWGEFSANNPFFKRYVSPPNKESVIYLPKEQQQAALEYLRKPEVRSLSGWQTYVVASKDNWNSISKKCNVPQTALIECNGNKKLTAGTSLRVPAISGREAIPARYAALAPSSSASSKARPDAVQEALKMARNTAKGGGNPIAINKTAVAYADIKTKECGPSGSLGKVQAKAVGKSAVHVVQPGDTFWSIARKYSMNPKDLIKINSSVGEQNLRPGATLVLNAN